MVRYDLINQFSKMSLVQYIIHINCKEKNDEDK